MSFRELAAASKARISPASKLVLLIMAETCGDDDDCHLSLEWLVTYCCMPEERVLTILKDLEAKKILTYRGPSQRYEGHLAFWFHSDKLDELRIPWDRKTGQAVAA